MDPPLPPRLSPLTAPQLLLAVSPPRDKVFPALQLVELVGAVNC